MLYCHVCVSSATTGRLSLNRIISSGRVLLAPSIFPAPLGLCTAKTKINRNSTEAPFYHSGRLHHQPIGRLYTIGTVGLTAAVVALLLPIYPLQKADKGGSQSGALRSSSSKRRNTTDKRTAAAIVTPGRLIVSTEQIDQRSR